MGEEGGKAETTWFNHPRGQSCLTSQYKEFTSFTYFFVTFPWLAIFHAVQDSTWSVTKSKVVFALMFGRNIVGFARGTKNGAYLRVNPLEIWLLGTIQMGGCR